jgi:hypothetical protein
MTQASQTGCRPVTPRAGNVWLPRLTGRDLRESFPIGQAVPIRLCYVLATYDFQTDIAMICGDGARTACSLPSAFAAPAGWAPLSYR